MVVQKSRSAYDLICHHKQVCGLTAHEAASGRPQPPRGRALHANLPSTPPHQKWPFPTCGTQTFPNRILQNILIFLHKLRLTPQSMIEEPILPVDPTSTCNPTLELADKIRHHDIFWELGDEVQMIRHDDGNGWVDLAKRSIVFQCTQNLDGDLLANERTRPPDFVQRQSKARTIHVCCDEELGPGGAMGDGRWWNVVERFARCEFHAPSVSYVGTIGREALSGRAQPPGGVILGTTWECEALSGGAQPPGGGNLGREAPSPRWLRPPRGRFMSTSCPSSPTRWLRPPRGRFQRCQAEDSRVIRNH